MYIQVGPVQIVALEGHVYPGWSVQIMAHRNTGESPSIQVGPVQFVPLQGHLKNRGTHEVGPVQIAALQRAWRTQEHMRNPA